MPYIRKVIRITAEDSPNVKVGLLQKANGLKPTNERVMPGVLDYATYVERRRLWDPVQQCIKLDAQFYEGSETWMYPADWRANAIQAGRLLRNNPPRAVSMGVDPAQGGDNTCWAVCGYEGLIALISEKTPETTFITSRTIALIREYGLHPRRVYFDQGGGGLQHAQRLRAQGYNVQTVSFGEAVAPEPVQYLVPFDNAVQDRRERFTYRNLRAKMYWLLRQRMDPGTPDEPYPFNGGKPFGIDDSESPAHKELHRQLSLIPLRYDQEGRIYVLPKNKRSPNSTEPSLSEILGCSPDEADALVLATYSLEEKSGRTVIRSMF